MTRAFLDPLQPPYVLTDGNCTAALYFFLREQKRLTHLFEAGWLASFFCDKNGAKFDRFVLSSAREAGELSGVDKDRYEAFVYLKSLSCHQETTARQQFISHFNNLVVYYQTIVVFLDLQRVMAASGVRIDDFEIENIGQEYVSVVEDAMKDKAFAQRAKDVSRYGFDRLMSVLLEEHGIDPFADEVCGYAAKPTMADLCQRRHAMTHRDSLVNRMLDSGSIFESDDDLTINAHEIPELRAIMRAHARKIDESAIARYGMEFFLMRNIGTPGRDCPFW